MLDELNTSLLKEELKFISELILVPPYLSWLGKVNSNCDYLSRKKLVPNITCSVLLVCYKFTE